MAQLCFEPPCEASLRRHFLFVANLVPRLLTELLCNLPLCKCGRDELSDWCRFVWCPSWLVESWGRLGATVATNFWSRKAWFHGNFTSFSLKSLGKKFLLNISLIVHILSYSNVSKSDPTSEPMTLFLFLLYLTELLREYLLSCVRNLSDLCAFCGLWKMKSILKLLNIWQLKNLISLEET